eukprot:796730_1
MNVQGILGECSRDIGKSCPKCPSNKPNYCQLKGGGICCSNECPISPEQPLCESVNTYDYYAFDYGKCAQGSGMKYCESTDECSRDTGKTCPKCPENKPYYRQIPGGGECCDQKDVSNTYVNAKGLGIHSNVDYGSNTCYTLSGTGLGVPDYNKCGQGTGMNWCETTSKCIRGATCPECKHDFADTIYCKDASGKEECCEGNECPSDDDDICISPERYNSGIGGTNECDSGERFCSSTGECLASNAGNECPVCPSDKLSWCQLMGGGLCCKYIPDDQKCAWTYTYSSAKGLGSVSKKDKGNGNGSGSGSDTCESATYDYFITDYGKCAQGSGTKYCESGMKYCESTDECSRD